MLVYKGIKLAGVEAKTDDLVVGEGVAQAKQYAEKLKLESIYQQKINDLKELKKSILQKPFRGELKTKKSHRDNHLI